jgi:hypothetical protein
VKNIGVGNKTYSELLRLKNMVSMDSGRITNLEVRKLLQIPDKGRWVIQEELFGNIMWEKDFEPEVTIEEFLKEVVSVIWHEQEQGKVIPFNLWSKNYYRSCVSF